MNSMQLNIYSKIVPSLLFQQLFTYVINLYLKYELLNLFIVSTYGYKVNIKQQSNKLI
jgi:hypothetical protein